MSAKIRMPTLRYILATTPRRIWRWHAVEPQEGIPCTLKELVEEGHEDEDTNVFCTGETLSPAARAIALLNPAVLAEISYEGLSSTEALEHLERLRIHFDLLCKRIFKREQFEHGEDLEMMQTQLEKAMTLLRRWKSFTHEELQTWLKVQQQPPRGDEDL